MKFSGVVTKHLGRGIALGFPTANIESPEGAEDGIYVGWTIIESWLGRDNKFSSLIFIGSNPTFNETYKRAEVYLLDFNDNLYGKEIKVETLEKIREVIRFDSAEDLIVQMKKDELVARKFFESYNLNN